MLDWKEITAKWKQRWADQKAFEANAKPGMKKFFCTFPYPYINGYLHVGHFYSAVRVDVFARYMRQRGYNVLFPQGWHCTGSPIESAAQRIREKEEKQWELMRQLGFSDQEIIKFEDPKHWTDFFPIQAKKDFESLGFSIDFRRSFITTELNPHYDAFIRWQFSKLKEKGYVVKGRFPVVWCTKDNNPVGDHSRVEGEGETPQEYVLMKYAYDDSFIVSATLRPETLVGDTNMWVNPDVTYVKANVNGEKWIVSKQAASKLKEQEKTVEIIEEVSGMSMVGKYCIAPMTNAQIPILPATFATPDIATGLVRSVPGHAPADWAALHELQSNEAMQKKYGLKKEFVNAIKPISMISVEGFGDFPAVEICERMKIKGQKDPKLDEATKEIYRKEGFTGKMKENTGKYSGLSVEQAKKEITIDLLKSKEGDKMYDLTGKVVCRCLTPSIVKIVSDQWFMKYSDEHWKREARECLSQMRLYPEQVRQQFEYVLGWLNNWACTREYGLGTKLPWDEKWVIESLSDSTIYMAFYTIAHLIQKVDPSKLNDSVFDYIFYGRGEKPHIEGIDKMREEFEYWYPLDFRNSGKDLIQNHLAFSIFNHVAIFEKSKWPRSFGVNGFVTVNGEKMSKSKGNIILMSQMAEKFTSDASRFTILSGGEYLDDANWDSEVALTIRPKLEKFYEFALMHYNKGTIERKQIDDWMDSAINEIIRDATEHMEKGFYRSALQKIFFDIQNKLKWYMKRTAGKPNKNIMNHVIKAQILMLAPFTPFYCDELWEKMGERGLVSDWPAFDPAKIKPELDELEQVMERTVEDAKTIMKLAKIEKANEIRIFIAEPWKFDLYKDLEKIFSETRDFKEILKRVMSHEKYKHHKETIPLIQKILKSGLPPKITTPDHEVKMLEDSKGFFKEEIGAEVKIYRAETSDEPKAKNSFPTKPAIKVI